LSSSQLFFLFMQAKLDVAEHAQQRVGSPDHALAAHATSGARPFHCVLLASDDRMLERNHADNGSQRACSQR
jgi:hypothetical protein